MLAGLARGHGTRARAKHVASPGCGAGQTRPIFAYPVRSGARVDVAEAADAATSEPRSTARKAQTRGAARRAQRRSVLTPF